MQVLLYALLCFIWGSTWLFIKVGYGGLGPFTVAAIRFFIASFVLALVVRARVVRWPRGRREWTLVLWLGVVLFGGNYALVYWAEQYIDSGLTAVLFATLPLVTIGFAHVLVPDDRITMRKLAGTILAFAGAAALFADHLQFDASRAWPMLAVLAGVVCSSWPAVLAKRDGAALDPAALNAPAMLIGAIVLTLASLVAGERLALPRDAATWGAVLYLAIVGSVISFLVYFSLLKTWSVTSLSFISVFTPIVALLLGFLVLDERPTIWTGIGAALVLAGVALALMAPRRR